MSKTEPTRCRGQMPSGPGALGAHCRSVPALALALRHTDCRDLPLSTATRLSSTDLVPFYQIEGGDKETEVQSAVHTISQIADKLRRMASAYGEWQSFDVPAFFDIYPEQVPLLVNVSERATAVHVTFFADMLLPSFQRTEKYWAEEFFPSYQAARPIEGSSNKPSDNPSSYTEFFFEITQPKMQAYWQRLLAVIDRVREELNDDISYLAAAGGREERFYWRRRQRDRSPAKGVCDDLLVPLQELPTLTLSVGFPLPAHRQPGRLRRLRRMWNRKDWRYGRNQSTA